MSDVSKTSELIAEARRSSDSLRNAPFKIDREAFADGIDALADALEAATRVPVQGEPNDDREALANLIDEIHDPLVTEGGCHFSGWSGGGFAGQREVSESVDALIARWPRATGPDAAKLPEAWSTEDRQESRQEAERRWSRPVAREAEQRYQSGCINGFMLGAEWQKARETFISYKVIADEARSERDAAIAAVERARAAAISIGLLGKLPPGDHSEILSAAAKDILAALDGAPEHEAEAEEEMYQAGCGSWDCRAPECGRA